VKLFSAILFLILFSRIAGATGDEVQINKALQFGNVHLEPRVYNIAGPVILPSNRVLSGETGTILRIDANSGQWYTGNTGIITCTDPKNIEIYGFELDGNCENLPASYNSNNQDPHCCERAIFIIGSSDNFGNNINIHDMTVHDTFSDGVHVRWSKNVRVSRLKESNCQHEGVYFCEVLGGEINNCDIAGMTSDCIRVESSQNVKVDNSILYSYSGDHNNGFYEHGESGIQVADQGVSFGVGSPKPDHIKNIEICNVTFANNGLKAINYGGDGSNIYIHDNKFIGKEEFSTLGVPVDVGNYTYQPTSHGTVFDLMNIYFETTLNWNKPSGYQNINSVNVSIMNNTFNPQTRYFVDTDNYTMKVCYEYNGQKNWHYIRIYENGQFKNVDTWKTTSDTGYLGNAFVVTKILNDTEQVKITVYSEFGSHQIENYTVIEYDEDSGSFINPVLFLVASLMFIFLGGIAINVRSMRYKWRRMF
jgi:hypothetical protein